MSAWENNEEIKIFREYLRIPSVHPNIDYSKLKLLLFFNLSVITNSTVVKETNGTKYLLLIN